jgi:ubiquinone/menaquinone biosynthesis C-methylase UbiE
MFHRDGPTLFELIRQGLSSTDAGYDQLAPKFDLTPFRTPDLLLEASAKYVGGPVERALDLCCGTGAGMQAFRASCTRAMVGVDRSAGMLAEAQRRLKARAGAPFVLARGDALALPFTQCFDLVTCFGAFGHILERDEPHLVEEVARVLKPRGRFVFITGDAPPLWHPGRLMAMGFNAAMHVRNALIDPPFVMYYLTFLLPRAQRLLSSAGFTVDAPRGVLPAPFHRLRLVVATRR